MSRRKRGYVRRERWCQRRSRVYLKTWCGQHRIYTILARHTDPGGPLGGVLFKPRNLQRNGRLPEAPPIVVHPEFVFALIGIDLDDMRKEWGSIPPLVLVQHGEARPIWDRGYLA